LEKSQSKDNKSYEIQNTEYQNGSQDINVDLIFENDQNESFRGSDASGADESTVDITFLAPISDSKYKRGNAIQIRWTGGNPEDEFALDLFDGRFHYRHVGELKNSGTYPWIIPKDVKPGKEYKFKLTNTNDFGEYAFSKSFIVKKKVPLAVWIVPGALIVGGAVYLLFFHGEGEIQPLPAPIEPN